MPKALQGGETQKAIGVWVAAGQSNIARRQVPEFFKLRMERTGKYRKVQVINVAVGGSALKEWMPGTPNYEEMLKSLKKNPDHVEGLLWWQGENEGVYGGAANWRPGLN